MRRHAMVAVELRPVFVDEGVAPEFPENRRAMSAELLGDDIDAQSHAAPSGELTAIVQVQLGVGALHRWLPATDNPLGSFASRASSLNPPAYIRDSHKISYGTKKWLCACCAQAKSPFWIRPFQPFPLLQLAGIDEIGLTVLASTRISHLVEAEEARQQAGELSSAFAFGP